MVRSIILLGDQIHDALTDCAYWDTDLCGACAIGSWMLVSSLKKKLGIKAKFVAADHHAYVEYNNYIYDVTATQFNNIKAKTFVLHKSKARYVRDKWQREAYLSDVRDTVSIVNKDWCKGQRPNEYKLIWINQNKAQVRYIG